jgi:hypothetical protein
MTGVNEEDGEVIDDVDHPKGNGHQCCKHIGLLKVGKDSHALYVSGRCQNNGSRKIVVCDIIWGMRPIDCLGQFLTARRRGIAVELKVVATAADLGKEFSRILPESLQRDLLELSDNGHSLTTELPLIIASSVSSSRTSPAYA